jgi:hypothetical protein
MSWTVLPVNQAQVREFLDVTGTAGQFSDGRIGSNIRAAASFLERASMRRFENTGTAETFRFTTEGRAYMSIPDMRGVTSVTLQSSALTADATYYLIQDAQHQGVYTGIQFRPFGRGNSYLSNPEWFDRNLDHPLMQARMSSGYSLPNDLVIVTSQAGWSPYPDEFLMATLVLAGFYTRRPASVLADVQVTPEGNELRYSQYPVEVQNFLKSWQAGDQLVTIR